MASLIDELIDVLDKEEKEYQDLILLSQEKTPVIIKGDLEKLQKITEAEQYVIGKVNKLEKKRTEVAKDITLRCYRHMCPTYFIMHLFIKTWMCFSYMCKS